MVCKTGQSHSTNANSLTHIPLVLYYYLLYFGIVYYRMVIASVLQKCEMAPFGNIQNA